MTLHILESHISSSYMISLYLPDRHPFYQVCRLTEIEAICWLIFLIDQILFSWINLYWLTNFIFLTILKKYLIIYTKWITIIKHGNVEDSPKTLDFWNSELSIKSLLLVPSVCVSAHCKALLLTLQIHLSFIYWFIK